MLRYLLSENMCFNVIIIDNNNNYMLHVRYGTTCTITCHNLVIFRFSDAIYPRVSYAAFYC